MQVVQSGERSNVLKKVLGLNPVIKVNLNCGEVTRLNDQALALLVIHT